MADHLPLTALKVFEATARHLNFSKAAEELHVTPGAVSQQIKSLEDWLGVKLLHRFHRRLELTDAGRAGVPALAASLEGMAESVRRIRAGTEVRRLRVWAPPSFAARWLIPRLGDFHAKHPDIELSISASVDMIGTGHNAEALTAERFYQREIDIGIFFGQVAIAECQQETLFTATLSPLCSPDLVHDSQHPLRSPVDLVHHRLIHDDTAYADRVDWKGWLEDAGIEGVDVRLGLHFNQVTLALKAATQGFGVVLAIRQLADIDIACGRLVIPFGPEVPLANPYSAICLDEYAQHPVFRCFLDWLQSVKVETLASLPGAIDAA